MHDVGGMRVVVVDDVRVAAVLAFHRLEEAGQRVLGKLKRES